MQMVEGLRRKIAARREVARVNFEAQEAGDYQRRLRDEVLDQAERLAAPMVVSLKFSLKEDGLYSDLNESLTKIQEEGIEEADRQAAANPDWLFEARRRRIERAGLGKIEDFTREFSTDGNVEITSMSLDRSNYLAMQAVAGRLGFDLPSNPPGSEEILSQYHILGDPPAALVNLSPCPDSVLNGNNSIPGYNRERRKLLVRIVAFDSAVRFEMTNAIRDAYDQSLVEQFGGQWFAGRRPEKDMAEAKTYIEAQPDLLAQHMKIVMRAYKIFGDSIDKADQRTNFLAEPRYNLAAALAHRRQGKEYGSLAEAGTAAKINNETYDGDCPVGALNTATTAGQLEALGFIKSLMTIDKCVNCPFCRRTVDARTKPGKNPITGKFTLLYECLSCHEAIDKKTGQRIGKVRQRMLGKLAAGASIPKQRDKKALAGSKSRW